MEPITINISRDDFVWSMDVHMGSEFVGAGTAPTFAGIYDMAYEIITEYDPQGTSFDANGWRLK